MYFIKIILKPMLFGIFFLSKVEPSAGTQTYHMFFISSPEPKVQVRFADHNLSVVCLHCCHCKLFKLSSSSPEPLGQFQPKLGIKHSWVKGIHVCSSEGPCLFPRGDNYEISKIHWQTLKTLILQNHWANFNQIWHKASLGEGNSRLFIWTTIKFSKSR